MRSAPLLSLSPRGMNHTSLSLFQNQSLFSTSKTHAAALRLAIFFFFFIFIIILIKLLAVFLR
jgi:hypothetical protein